MTDVKRYTAIEAYNHAYSSSTRYVLASDYDSLLQQRDMLRETVEAVLPFLKYSDERGAAGLYDKVVAALAATGEKA